MPADDESPYEPHSSDVAFLLPIVARLGVDQVCRLAYRAGQILAAADAASADQPPVLRPVRML